MPDAQEHMKVADALAGRGRLAEACDQYGFAIDLQPTNPRLQFQLGTCEWRLGRVSAGSRFQRALEIDEKFITAYAALASWQLQHGLVEEANASSRRGMEIAPLDDNIMQARAAVLEAAGDLEQAWRMVTLLVDRGFTPMPVIRLFGRMARYHHQQPRALDLVDRRMAFHSCRVAGFTPSI
jgi:Flp pilus assembly protein TadD